MESIIFSFVLIAILAVLAVVYIRNCQESNWISSADIVPESVYLLIFMLITVKDIMNSSFLFDSLPDSIDMLLNLVLVFLTAVKLFSQKLTAYTMAFYGIVGLCCAYTSLVMHDFYLAYTYMLIVAIKGVNIERILNIHMIFTATVLFIHVIYFAVVWWIAPETIIVTYREGLVRYAFFMVHPNKFSMYLLWVTLEWLYLRYQKLKIYHLGLITILHWIVYQFTGSRSALILIVFIIMLIIFTFYFPNLGGRIVGFAAKYGFTISLLTFAIIAMTYGKYGSALDSIYNIVNKIVNGRLTLSSYAAQNYGFSLLGQNLIGYTKFFWLGAWYDQVYLDSCYALLLWGYGVVYAVLLAVLFARTAKLSDTRVHIFLVAHILYGLMENYGMNAANCFSLLFIGVFLYHESESKYRIE